MFRRDSQEANEFQRWVAGAYGPKVGQIYQQLVEERVARGEEFSPEPILQDAYCNCHQKTIDSIEAMAGCEFRSALKLK